MYTYAPSGVCARRIDVELDDDGQTIKQVSFVGGCNGNLKAISKLVDGWTVDRIEQYLKGNICGRRPTSCADQLAIAVRKAYEETHAA